MSTKPTIGLARWADTGGADKTAPSSGARDIGFQEGDPADQSIVNELLYQHYLWAQYVSEGTLDGDVVIGGSLTVGGQLLSFTDFTYTADNTTDQIAHTAHGLETGDGPVRTSNSGGGLPGGLAAATDYYFIKVDADHGRVSTSRANALAGTYINITSNGTGTQTLLHQTGTTRVEDATVSRNLLVGGGMSVGGEIYGVRTDQHDIAAWTGTATRVDSPSGPAIPVWSLATSQTLRARIPYEIGDIVTGVRLEVYGDGAIDWIASLTRPDGLDGVGGETIANGNVTNQSAAWAMESLSVSATLPMPAGGFLYLVIVLTGGTQLYMSSVEITTRRAISY